MKKMNAAAAVLIAAALALLGIASFKLKPAASPDTTGAKQAASASNPHARYRALIDRYALSARELDSLERNAPARGENAVYSRLLREAHTRRDHTQFAFDLLGYADTADPTAWEVARARAQDSLDSLDRSIRLAEEGSFRPEAPGPPPSRALQEAARSDSG